ncbi:MAG: CPBP family intramembrane metalloprotease [Lachnospiraceae bacterium]|jgi:hypothetical protein|nr:CPBP family intramembrane metalloprotease [Lachnospiraceae bacterium]
MKKFFRKLGQVLVSFLPILITLGIQLAVTIPVTIYYFGFLGFNGQLKKQEGVDIIQWLTDLMLHSDYAIYVTVVWGIISMVVFILWYRHIHDSRRDVPVRTILTPYAMGGLALLVVGLQLSINYFYSLIEPLMPGVFEQYNEVLSFPDSTPIGLLILMIYGVIIAPIHEEFLNRGVTLHFANKAMPFWLANLFQALLFGLLHMNLVQGSYAFIVGIVIGLIYRSAKNIWIPIFFHMAFNLFGTVVPLMPLKTSTSSAYMLVGLIGVAIAVSGGVLYHTSLRIRE